VGFVEGKLQSSVEKCNEREGGSLHPRHTMQEQQGLYEVLIRTIHINELQ
jgi:hypothetical protein